MVALGRYELVRFADEDGLNEAGERACASFALPVAKSTRTHHWGVLREAGLIRQHDAGDSTLRSPAAVLRSDQVMASS
jgi:hypothetical protein